MSAEAKKQYVKITPQMIDLLKAEVDRTGKGPAAIFAGRRKETPRVLTSTMVKGWISGTIKQLQLSHFFYVEDLYRKTEDLKDTQDKKDELRRSLEAQLKASAISPYKLMKGVKNAPSGVNAQYIYNVINGQQAKIDRERVEFLINLVNQKTAT